MNHRETCVKWLPQLWIGDGFIMSATDFAAKNKSTAWDDLIKRYYGNDIETDRVRRIRFLRKFGWRLVKAIVTFETHGVTDET